MEANASSEDALWHRAIGGDGIAFGTIFDLHRDRVFRHCYQLLRTRHDAEDATAVAFLELWRKRRSVRVVNGSTLPWLLATATNTSRNVRRYSRRYQQLLQRLPRVELAAPSDEQLHDSVVSQDLALAVRKLGSRDAELFCLVALEGYSTSEAAQILGATPEAARTRLHRIRRKLQDQLGRSNAEHYRFREAT